MFSLCLHGKQLDCFPGKHELYMYSNPVFLEYRDHPQQWSLVWTSHYQIPNLLSRASPCQKHQQIPLLSVLTLLSSSHLLFSTVIGISQGWILSTIMFLPSNCALDHWCLPLFHSFFFGSSLPATNHGTTGIKACMKGQGAQLDSLRLRCTTTHTSD